MTFLIYLALGLITIIPWFPKAFVRFVDREWPSMPWDGTDTVAFGVGIAVAILLWPLAIGLCLFSVLAIKFLHRPLARMFDREREVRLKGKS